MSGYRFRSQHLSLEEWERLHRFWEVMTNDAFLAVWPPSDFYHVCEESRRKAFRMVVEMRLGLRTL